MGGYVANFSPVQHERPAYNLCADTRAGRLVEIQTGPSSICSPSHLLLPLLTALGLAIPA